MAFNLLDVTYIIAIFIYSSEEISKIKGAEYNISKLHKVDQGSSNLSLEGQSAAEFSSNPDQTHLPVIF